MSAVLRRGDVVTDELLNVVYAAYDDFKALNGMNECSIEKQRSRLDSEAFDKERSNFQRAKAKIAVEKSELEKQLLSSSAAYEKERSNFESAKADLEKQLLISSAAFENERSSFESTKAKIAVEKSELEKQLLSSSAAFEKERSNFESAKADLEKQLFIFRAPLRARKAKIAVEKLELEKQLLSHSAAFEKERTHLESAKSKIAVEKSELEKQLLSSSAAFEKRRTHLESAKAKIAVEKSELEKQLLISSAAFEKERSSFDSAKAKIAVEKSELEKQLLSSSAAFEKERTHFESAKAKLADEKSELEKKLLSSKHYIQSLKPHLLEQSVKLENYYRPSGEAVNFGQSLLWHLTEPDYTTKAALWTQAVADGDANKIAEVLQAPSDSLSKALLKEANEPAATYDGEMEGYRPIVSLLSKILSNDRAQVFDTHAGRFLDKDRSPDISICSPAIKTAHAAYVCTVVEMKPKDKPLDNACRGQLLGYMHHTARAQPLRSRFTGMVSNVDCSVFVVLECESFGQFKITHFAPVNWTTALLHPRRLVHDEREQPLKPGFSKELDRILNHLGMTRTSTVGEFRMPRPLGLRKWRWMLPAAPDGTYTDRAGCPITTICVKRAALRCPQKLRSEIDILDIIGIGHDAPLSLPQLVYHTKDYLDQSR
ncbi:hypothetical protein FN846DRAFT_886027 [Sphaerosporella brunnea]|uniref:DUF6826 domain-containing protein n=1 Tax=Sphaerosporella brunnea TaxID=1250544 RepID=A0A5J5FBT3_9PEZI|nr:hypothetical protein FN846DRAFT_886027 [Sphaerosporella brunnea]